MTHLLKHHENALCGLAIAPLTVIALIVGPRTIAGPYWGTLATFCICLACAGWVWSALTASKTARKSEWVERATTPLSAEELERLERMMGVEAKS